MKIKWSNRIFVRGIYFSFQKGDEKGGREKENEKKRVNLFLIRCTDYGEHRKQSKTFFGDKKSYFFPFKSNVMVSPFKKQVTVNVTEKIFKKFFRVDLVIDLLRAPKRSIIILKFKNFLGKGFCSLHPPPFAAKFFKISAGGGDTNI